MFLNFHVETLTEIHYSKGKLELRKAHEFTKLTKTAYEIRNRLPQVKTTSATTEYRPPVCTVGITART